MHTRALILLVGVGAVVGTFVAEAGRQVPPVADRPATPPKLARPEQQKHGHLILQLEGDVRRLDVTFITPKPSAYNATRVESPFEIDLFDGAGARLGTYPIDLSRFDTDPARIGKPLRVEGCVVRDSRIVTIVNVPYFEQTATVRIRNRDAVIGRLDAARFTRLVQQGEVR